MADSYLRNSPSNFNHPVLYGYAPVVIETVLETAPAAVRRLLLDGSGTILVLDHPEDAEPDPFDFEAWLIERWLKHVRSEAFQETAEYQFLRGEWERSL